GAAAEGAVAPGLRGRRELDGLSRPGGGGTHPRRVDRLRAPGAAGGARAGLDPRAVTQGPAQRAPRRLNAAAAQSARPMAWVYPLPFAGQRSLSKDMSPAVLVLPLALLQLQLSLALCTVETGQSGASSGRSIAAASPCSSSARWAVVSVFGFSRSRGGFRFFA